MLPILSVKNLSKDYGKKRVVKNLNFDLFEGQIFGFVGPNGAGKSTTLKMITGLTNITEGEVRICGYNVKYSYKKAISNVGAVIETPQLYPYLSGEANLKLFAKFYGRSAMNRIKDIVKLVGMENRIKDKFSNYSLGMKQRVGIAQALLNKPKLLILDEPTNGLDPDGIAEIRNILRVLAEKERITIIISSHNLAELEQLCDVIGLINDGNLIDFKSMKEIKKLTSANQKIQISCNYPNYAAFILKEKYKIEAKILGNSILAPLRDEDLASAISILTNKKIKIYEIKKIRKTLEELYFEMLNKTRPSTSII